jgi:hypothetical protein
MVFPAAARTSIVACAGSPIAAAFLPLAQFYPKFVCLYAHVAGVI